MQGVEAFPLCWPTGWKRHDSRSHSKFKITFWQARSGLMNEIKLLGGTLPVLTTNVPIRKDGLPYADAKGPADPGAAVYFMLKGKQMCFACDKWKTLPENTQALRRTIEAIRGIERWSASDMMERAFRGFTALPAPGSTFGHPPWWSVLGLPGERPMGGMAAVKTKRNELLRKYHPDFGTDPDVAKMAEINEAFAQAELELA